MRILYAMSFVALGAVALWLLLSDAPPLEPPADAARPAPPAEAPAAAAAAAPDPIEVERDRRLAAMQREYTVLERERDALGGELRALQRRLAAASLPEEAKRSLTQELGRISFYVGNPKMLGAFADADAIRRYTEELRRARARVATIAADL